MTCNSTGLASFYTGRPSWGRAFICPVLAKFIGHQTPRFIALAFQNLAKEALSRLSIATRGTQFLTSRTGVTPLYQQVKTHIIDKIHSGELLPASRVPSENELVRALNVSRMTANRALKELAAEGLVTRVAGVGTFVAGTQTSGHLVAVTNIADDVRERGHEYANVVLQHRRARPPDDIAQWMGLAPDATAFHPCCFARRSGGRC